MNPIDIFIGFISGIFTGIIIQYVRFRYTSRIEKMKRLSRYLESAFPIVEKLTQDSRYAVNIHLEDDQTHLSIILKKIALSFREYANWFTSFRADGMVPELESLNDVLSSRFYGLFAYSRLGRQHGVEYISQQIQDLATYCEECKRELKRQLSE